MSDGGELKALMAALHNPTGGPTYFERHGHMPDEDCSMFCPGNPAKFGGNGGGVRHHIEADEWDPMYGWRGDGRTDRG